MSSRFMAYLISYSILLLPLGDEAANRPRALLGLRVLEEDVVWHPVECHLRHLRVLGARDVPQGQALRVYGTDVSAFPQISRSGIWARQTTRNLASANPTKPLQWLLVEGQAAKKRWFSRTFRVWRSRKSRIASPSGSWHAPRENLTMVRRPSARSNRLPRTGRSATRAASGFWAGKHTASMRQRPLTRSGYFAAYPIPVVPPVECPQWIK